MANVCVYIYIERTFITRIDIFSILFTLTKKTICTKEENKQ